MKKYNEEALNQLSDKPKKLLSAILEFQEELEKKGKGGTLKGMVVAVGDLYPKERATILSIFAQPRKGIDPNRKKVKAVDLSPSDDDGLIVAGCKDCGASSATKTSSTPKLTDAENATEVLEYFSAGVGEDEGKKKMLKYCEVQAIKCSSNSKPITIAGKIYTFISDPTNVIV